LKFHDSLNNLLTGVIFVQSFANLVAAQGQDVGFDDKTTDLTPVCQFPGNRIDDWMKKCAGFLEFGEKALAYLYNLLRDV